MKIKNFLFSCFLLWLCLSNLWADDAKSALAEKLKAIKTLSASFKQNVLVKNHIISSSEGDMALSRPNLFRWHTKNPIEQLIVADGHTVWIYDIDLEQVSMKSQADGLGETVALFLSDSYDHLSTQFKILRKSTQSKEKFELKSLSKKSNFKQVFLEFSGAHLEKIAMVDHLGQRTEILFNDLRLNQDLSPDFFRFKPPKNIDWVNRS